MVDDPLFVPVRGIRRIVGEGREAADASAPQRATLSEPVTVLRLQRLEPSEQRGGATSPLSLMPEGNLKQLLIDELQTMGNEDRAKFLNFVTACPHLPPVGLSMLEIEVLPQHNGGLLPTAQTCGNKLYLPEYDDAPSLRAGLAEAFANADFGGLHERAG